MDRFIMNGDTFIDTYNNEVLIGFKGILEKLNDLNDENLELQKENKMLLKMMREGVI